MSGALRHNSPWCSPCKQDAAETGASLRSAWLRESFVRRIHMFLNLRADFHPRR